MARAARGGAGQRQHLRRLRGHRADARHVQEEGALTAESGARAVPSRTAPPGCCSPIWSSGVLLHPRAARPVEPGEQPARQPLRHDRHADRGGDHARPLPSDRHARCWRGIAIDYTLFARDPGRDRDRRGDRPRHRARIAMTAMPQLVAAFHSPRRHGGGAGRRGRLPQPRRLRHRSDRRTALIHHQSAGSRWGSASRSARSPSRAR